MTRMPMRPFGLLLLGLAYAQQQPTIEDMLADSSSSPTQTGPVASGNSPASGPVGNPVGIGSQLGATQSASQPSQSKDMFGRGPTAPVNPLAALFGGKKGGASGAAAGPGNPIMDSLLNSVEAKMPINQKMAQKSGIKQPISQESQEIVSGIVGAFMHKVALSQGEKSCLERNLAHLAGDVVGASQDVIKAIKAIIAGRPQTKGFSDRFKAQSEGTMVSVGLDGGMKLTSLITETTTLMKNCVKGDALDMLKQAGQNFIDVKYVSHRLLVSGVDIAHRLSDGIIAFEGNQWHRFGQDIGIAMRKIVLSNSTRGSRLPEGVPEEAIIQETTEGLMEGFFARGTGVEITDKAAPDVDIQLDLHRCIAGNHEFFKEIWLAMWNLIAEMAVDAGKHEFNNPFSQMSGGAQGGEQPKWMGEIMVAMMQVPMALSRCNIGQETQQMLMQAIKSIQYLKVHFLFPKQGAVTGDEATQRMAQAVEAWTNWNFKGFGQQIGKLLREFVLLMYPQQYYVDPTGRLKRQLNMKSSENSVKVGGMALSTSFVSFVVAGVSLSMLMALAAVRGLRLMSSNKHRESANGEGSDVENFLEVE